MLDVSLALLISSPELAHALCILIPRMSQSLHFFQPGKTTCNHPRFRADLECMQLAGIASLSVYYMFCSNRKPRRNPSKSAWLTALIKAIKSPCQPKYSCVLSLTRQSVVRLSVCILVKYRASYGLIFP